LLNELFKQKFPKQIKSSNLDNISKEIFNKTNGVIDLPGGIQIVWNKNYIDFKN